MGELIELIRSTLLSTLASLDVRNVIDILVVAAIAYFILSLIHGTTAVALLRGLALVFAVGAVASQAFQLMLLGWLLRNAIPALLIAVPVLFQPELRRVLEQIGRAGPLGIGPGVSANQRTIEIVASAANQLAEHRWGAIIVMERQIALGEYADTGIRIDGALSVEFVESIFYPKSPLHDGAVIIRGDRLLAAACVLPLAESMESGHQFGTRHRAAIGISAKTDALAVVVSEETGRISIANNGRLVGNLDEEKLRRVLPMIFRTTPSEAIPPFFRRRILPKAS